MKIRQWGKTDHDPGGLIVLVTPKEAIRLIKSLATQLGDKDSNHGRDEFYVSESQTSFSIGVIPEGEEVIFHRERICLNQTSK